MTIFAQFDILVLDNDGEFIDLLFEGLHTAIQTLDLLALEIDDLLGVFKF